MSGRFRSSRTECGRRRRIGDHDARIAPEPERDREAQVRKQRRPDPARRGLLEGEGEGLEDAGRARAIELPCPHADDVESDDDGHRIWTSVDGLNLDDGWGVKGVITPFYGDKGLRVVYARGRYEQSVLPDIRGQAIIFVRYGESGATAGRPALVTFIHRRPARPGTSVLSRPLDPSSKGRSTRQRATA